MALDSRTFALVGPVDAVLASGDYTANHRAHICHEKAAALVAPPCSAAWSPGTSKGSGSFHTKLFSCVLRYRDLLNHVRPSTLHNGVNLAMVAGGHKCSRGAGRPRTTGGALAPARRVTVSQVKGEHMDRFSCTIILLPHKPRILRSYQRQRKKRIIIGVHRLPKMYSVLEADPNHLE